MLLFHQRTVQACLSWAQCLTSPKSSAQDGTLSGLELTLVYELITDLTECLRTTQHKIHQLLGVGQKVSVPNVVYTYLWHQGKFVHCKTLLLNMLHDLVSH